MPPYRIAHLSDPHLPPPKGALRPRDLVSKRALSALAWRRKGKEHRPAVLAALSEDICAYAPDHICLTGDLTNFSTPAEFAAARAWLAGFSEPSRLTVSPGNHDALVPSRDPEPFSAWREWLSDEAPTRFPAVRERGPVAVVNLCSAVPTAPWSAGGRLGDEQLARLAETLAQLRHSGLFRIITVHHPPCDRVVSKRKALRDAGALRAVLGAHGAELVLHGHGHEPDLHRIEGPDGPIPVLGAPSASSAGDRHAAARWHALEISPGQVRVSVRGLSARGGFETLGRYVLETPHLR